jgi:hypothetical protein
MSPNVLSRVSPRTKAVAGALGLLLAGGLAGGALAATSSASAADATPTTTAGAPAAAAPVGPAPGDRGDRGDRGGSDDSATPVRPGEKALTGASLATAKAAALKAVPGGTVFRVETDVDGATYEAHMTKADGTRVTVKLDKDFKVTAVQAGMGAGGPRGPGGPDDRQGPGSASPSDDSIL